MRTHTHPRTYIHPHMHHVTQVEIWRKRCAPVLEAANVAFETCVTARARHAVGLAHDIDLQRYGGLVVVGGDGIMNEVLEGLMGRDDWRRAMQLPLGIVPGGTGNGMAISILHGRGNIPCTCLCATACRHFRLRTDHAVPLICPGEAWEPENMAFLIAKGSISPMDLSTVRAFSLLSATERNRGRARHEALTPNRAV